jgi:(4-(4-[2-(gamma-L-glutamylamino)ethyl]phenoxymethyl)furan-2-yl)methanamine synthase
MKWLALDIGGANIKVADGGGYAASYPFAMWSRFDQLAQELRRIIAEAPASDHLVATMTGELADCFESKEQGVLAILDALHRAADGRHTRVYAHDGALLTPVVAGRRYAAVAAANWHALARFVGRYMELGAALLLDVGSTTCDVIPFRDGLPIHTGMNDTQRLITGELVYTGIQRSPVCAVCQTVPYRDHLCPVAQELFATTADAYVILGDLPEDTATDYTADGRPATKPYARARLARTICADGEQFNHRDAVAIAQAVSEAQTDLLTAAMERVLQRLNEMPPSVVISGHGEFLAQRAIRQFGMEAVVISLRQQLGSLVSRCATAHALAVIANESAGA